MKLVQKKSLYELETVPYARPGLNVVWPGGILLHLVAKLADVHTQKIHLTAVSWPPDRLEQLAVSEDLARMRHHLRQQIEFGFG